jgi:hypothetical protein
VHGDQTGRDGGGTKKVKEENETLDDIEHNEDRRGCCYQPLLKPNPEAADRSPSRKRRCATRLDEKRADGVESLRSCEPPESLHFQTIGVFRAL